MRADSRSVPTSLPVSGSQRQSPTANARIDGRNDAQLQHKAAAQPAQSPPQPPSGRPAAGSALPGGRRVEEDEPMQPAADLPSPVGAPSIDWKMLGKLVQQV